MKVLSVLLFGIILTGCITLHTPQSRHEYISAVAKGEGYTKVHNYTVARKFNSVVKNINRKSKSCLSKKITHTWTRGYSSHVSSSTYNPSMRYINKSKAEFTLQVIITPNNTTKPPAGGMYFLAANINKISKNKTKVIIYAPSINADDIVNSIKNWSKGIKSKCPDLP